MDKDLDIKRRKFIGKYHALLQEFGFSTPETLFKLISIYATSFYGSVLWDLSGAAAEHLYRSWNILIRSIWKLPNTSHRYFIEEVSDSSHIKTILSQRCLTFFHSLVTSKKKCLSELAKKMIMDQGSKSGRNLNYISINSGFERHNIMTFHPATVANAMKYCPVPEDCLGKVSS